MVTNHTAYKHETPYKGPVVITQCFTNGRVNLRCGAVQMKYNIHRIKPYEYDTKVVMVITTVAGLITNG